MRKAFAILLLLALVMGVAAVDQRQALGQNNATVAATGALNETWTQTYIAQQNLQRGYMFWISTQKTIWVLIKADENATSGEWRVYPDTFQSGDPEMDTNLTPPDITHDYQPRRGFGKVWRETPGLRDALGWGTTPEFDLITPLSYLSTSGGSRYLLTTLSAELIALYEATPGQPGGRWEMVGRVIPGDVVRATTTPKATAAATAAQSGGPVTGPVTTPQP